MPNAKFYWKNRERLLAQEAYRYVNNRERILARNKAWNAAHPEVMNRTSKEWDKLHPEKNVAVRAKHYTDTHRELCRARCREYAKAHPESSRARGNKRRTAKTFAGGSFTASEWLALCKQYHNRCLCCGKRRKLTADHVIPVSKGGTSNIDNIHPLCGPCNSSKRDKTIDYRGRTYARTKQ